MLKICICQKFVVPLHRNSKRSYTNQHLMNQIVRMFTIKNEHNHDYKNLTNMYIVYNKSNNAIIAYCDTKEDAIAWRNNYNSSGIKRYAIKKINK